MSTYCLSKTSTAEASLGSAGLGRSPSSMCDDGMWRPRRLGRVKTLIARSSKIQRLQRSRAQGQGRSRDQGEEWKCLGARMRVKRKQEGMGCWPSAFSIGGNVFAMASHQMSSNSGPEPRVKESAQEMRGEKEATQVKVLAEQAWWAARVALASGGTKLRQDCQAKSLVAALPSNRLLPPSFVEIWGSGRKNGASDVDSWAVGLLHKSRSCPATAREPSSLSFLDAGNAGCCVPRAAERGHMWTAGRRMATSPFGT
ncbi:hypothetical protein BS50DRAFT_231398 [Corynespora cassiicola Philippines]|uniref:Uncharacterized protein n=1 Tax=Corynespora cassiicola Philippines TaxID=1448308 RepID=A0A2T2N1Y0_CORCC|nr:hypothetical protein BS50DRAFT_231398 [Corynespora cassiicola Philippines]